MDSVWITPVDVLDRTAVYRFEKTVNATKKAVIELNISADTRYRFYVNGRAPARATIFSGDMRQ